MPEIQGSTKTYLIFFAPTRTPNRGSMSGHAGLEPSDGQDLGEGVAGVRLGRGKETVTDPAKGQDRGPERRRKTEGKSGQRQGRERARPNWRS